MHRFVSRCAIQARAGPAPNRVCAHALVAKQCTKGSSAQRRLLRAGARVARCCRVGSMHAMKGAGVDCACVYEYVR